MFSNFRRIKNDIEQAAESGELQPLYYSLAWVAAAIVTSILWILAFLSISAVILWASWIVDIAK